MLLIKRTTQRMLMIYKTEDNMAHFPKVRKGDSCSGEESGATSIFIHIFLCLSKWETELLSVYSSVRFSRFSNNR